MTGSTHTKPRARSLMSSLCIAAMLALALALAVGFGGSLHPAFDSFAHLRIHVAGLLGLAGLAAFGLGLRAAGVGAVIVAGLAVASTLASPFWHSPAAAGADIAQQDVARYRLLQLNLRFDHPEPNRVLSLIARAQPDIVTLNEVSPHWRLALERIAAAYPHRLVCAASAGVGGVAILSRRPFAANAGKACAPGGRFAHAGIDLGGTTVTVAAVHFGWPWPSRQAGEAARLAPVIAALGGPTILAGDFNATPWSAFFTRFVADGGFETPPRIGATWLYQALPRALRPALGLPIDHVMTRGGVRLVQTAAGADAGSDHVPVLADFVLDPPAGAVPAATIALAASP
ncbi:MAG: endonuclease/exonuclease/phosphatase family protein [Nitratireductor sp.]